VFGLKGGENAPRECSDRRGNDLRILQQTENQSALCRTAICELLLGYDPVGDRIVALVSSSVTMVVGTLCLVFVPLL
jgi:hypothetical protein